MVLKLFNSINCKFCKHSEIVMSYCFSLIKKPYFQVNDIIINKNDEFCRVESVSAKFFIIYNEDQKQNEYVLIKDQKKFYKSCI